VSLPEARVRPFLTRAPADKNQEVFFPAYCRSFDVLSRSVLTLVVALNDPTTDFDGGVFRTHEADGTQREHRLAPGDCLCLVSHKYHNVTPVTRGTRRSLVVELWEGGSRLHGR